MLQKVLSLSMEYDMLPRGGRVLCAVSGGADSMCLLHLLGELAKPGGFTIAAAHFHHHLRGAESDRDAAFVAKWCAARDILFVMGEGDVNAQAQSRGLGVEETARQLRYDFLRQSAEALDCTRIATAHNADDNLETLLLHLVRGAGLHGLSGIPPRRDGIVRPLLACSRAEVLSYLAEHGIPHVEDSSNSDEAYARNRLRHQVVPVLRDLNPRLSEGVTATMALLRADNDYLNAQAALVCANARWAEDDLVIEARLIAELPPAIAPRAVRRLLEMLGDGNTNCSSAHLNAVVELARGSDPSAVVFLPGGKLAQRVYRELLLTRSSDPMPPFLPAPLVLDGETLLEGTPWRVRCRSLPCPDESERLPGAVYLDRDKVDGVLLLRPRQTGDEIALPRRGGTKTLKKLFIDEKVPRREREHIPVLADRAGVAAVAGFGADQRRLAQTGGRAYELLFWKKE